jgi:hypothetical protein
MTRPEIVRALRIAFTTETCVWVRRRFDRRGWRGFVVGMSDDLALLHLVHALTLTFNGYLIVRLRDVIDCQDDTSFVPAALKLRGERPVPQLDILLDDIPGVLSSVGAHFPLMDVLQEKREAPCHVGRITRLDAKRAHLTPLDEDGFWQEPVAIRFKNITRVHFGDGYNDGLWLVARHRPRPRQENR